MLRRRSGLAPIAIGLMLVTGSACDLLISDWRVGPSTSASTATTGGEGAGTGGGGGAGGAGGAAPVPATPLASVALGPDPLTDGVAVFREGFFRLEAGPESTWQWARWFYLPADPRATQPLGPVIYDGSVETPFYRTVCLWTAIRGHGSDTAGAEGYSPRSCKLTPETTSPVVEGRPSFDDSRLPVWFTLGGEADDSWGGLTTFQTRVFASGRVWTWTHFVNTSSSPLVYDNAETIFGLIGLKSSEFFLPAPDEEGLFPMKQGGGALLAVDTGRLLPDDPGPTPGATWEASTIGLTGDGIAGTWRRVIDLPSQAVVEIPFAFLLGPSVSLEAEREARTIDLRSPGLEIEAGATTLFTMWGGLDPETGTYTLAREAGATSVTFSLAASNSLGDPVTRFEPAFEITDWSSPVWTIRLGDEVLGRSTAQGPNILAVHSGTTIAFQYLGSIAAEAADDARTFTVSEE
jgi:hypothetical protein